MGEMPVRAFHGPHRARAAIHAVGAARQMRPGDRPSPFKNVTDYPLLLRDLLVVPKDYCGTATFTCDLLHKLRCEHRLVMSVTEVQSSASAHQSAIWAPVVCHRVRGAARPVRPGGPM